MNKGLYKADGHLYWYKTWENSTENSGESLSLELHVDTFERFYWNNYYNPLRPMVGTECLAQW